MTDLIQTLASHFELLQKHKTPYLQFRHIKTGIIFNYISGGEYDMGFSDAEERAALALTDDFQVNVEAMRPVKHVIIKPFLISCCPVLNYQAKLLLPTFQYSEEYAQSPAYFKREEAINVVNAAECRLPMEEEWEYCHRAGTKSLFAWGDYLPSEDVLAEWMACNCSTNSNAAQNKFGLKCLFFPEWCLDEYRVNYRDNASKIESSYVVRGGGAYFWPWQDEEWVWCMAAMRFPSRDLINAEACLRLSYGIP